MHEILFNMHSEEQKFIEGFNNGYLISKHEPKLSTQLLNKLNPTTEYTKGLILGKEEYLKEKDLNQLQELDKLRKSSRRKNIELDRDDND